MATGKKWYLPLDVGDWMSDPAVCLLKPATRGIWLDAICAMHSSGQTGQTTGSVTDLSRLCRCSPNEMLVAIYDLVTREAADVYGPDGEKVIREPNGRLSTKGVSVTCNTVVTLVCRRMKREATDRKSIRDRVRTHRARKCNTKSNGSVTPHSNSKSNSKSKKEEDIPLPECLRVDPFPQTWDQWRKYRAEIRHALTPTTSRMQLAKLAKMGPDAASRSLVQSMEHGWQGIFEPEDPASNNSQGSMFNEDPTDRARRLAAEMRGQS